MLFLLLLLSYNLSPALCAPTTTTASTQSELYGAISTTSSPYEINVDIDPGVYKCGWEAIVQSACYSSSTIYVVDGKTGYFGSALVDTARGSYPVVLDAERERRIMGVQNSTISLNGVTFRGGVWTDAAGLMIWEGGEVTLTLCAFFDCQAKSERDGGGAIGVYFGSLEMSLVMFLGNEGSRGKDLLVWDGAVTIHPDCADGETKQGDQLDVGLYAGGSGSIVGPIYSYERGTCFASPSDAPTPTPVVSARPTDAPTKRPDETPKKVAEVVALSVAIAAPMLFLAWTLKRLWNVRVSSPLMDLNDLEAPLLEVAVGEGSSVGEGNNDGASDEGQGPDVTVE